VTTFPLELSSVIEFPSYELWQLEKKNAGHQWPIPPGRIMFKTSQIVHETPFLKIIRVK
jgi:hypothetical protein